MQRKVSHILVKRDQEHLLDDIEDRLAGARTTMLTSRFLANSQSIFSVGNHVKFAPLSTAKNIMFINCIACIHIAFPRSNLTLLMSYGLGVTNGNTAQLQAMP